MFPRQFVCLHEIDRIAIAHSLIGDITTHSTRCDGGAGYAKEALNVGTVMFCDRACSRFVIFSNDSIMHSDDIR